MLLFDEPIIIPPQPPKAYPIVHIRNLQTQAHDPKSEASLYVEILPMSEDLELLYSGVQELKTNELYRAMREVPEVANVFSAILAAIKPLKNWIESQKQEEIEPE